MKSKILKVLAAGAAGALLSAVMPIAICPYLPQRTPIALASAVRLPDTPAQYPDPNVTWVTSGLGLQRESSIRGIGIEDFWTVDRLRAGWPFFMLEGSEHSEVHSVGRAPAAATIHPVGLLRVQSAGQVWTIPLRLRAWGAAGNWAVWSVAVASSMFVADSSRKAWRRRRGQCVACGYPRPAGKRCPECGLCGPLGAA